MSQHVDIGTRQTDRHHLHVDVLAQTAARVMRTAADHRRVLVGVDGPPAAGKTTLADQLACLVQSHTVRASVDDFHHPAAVRRRRGDRSAEGYYLDAFDLAALRRQLLEPFRNGAPTVCTRAHDLVTDQPTRHEVQVPVAAVLIVDGVFLLKPELAPLWTLAIYLEVAADVTLQRAVARDAGPAEEIRRRYAERYLPAQTRYCMECDPQGNAHLVVGNTDPANPVLL